MDDKYFDESEEVDAEFKRIEETVLEAFPGLIDAMSIPHIEKTFHEIKSCYTILADRLPFGPIELQVMIGEWCALSVPERERLLANLKGDAGPQLFTAVVSEVMEGESFSFDAMLSFNKACESAAAIDANLSWLPPLQSPLQFREFFTRIGMTRLLLFKDQEKESWERFRFEWRKVSRATVRILEAFEILRRAIPAPAESPASEKEVPSETRPRETQAHGGTSTYPYRPPRNIVVSSIMERGDEIAKSAAESVQAMRIVLSALEGRRSNDPAESELKEQLAILIEKIGEARDATERATESGVIEDAEVAAETIEKSKTLWDDAVRRMADIGLNSAGAISCFAVALGATATFTAAGFAIPPLAALAVSAGFFGVSAVMDNLPGAKGTS
jgi:hypothetical protein